MLWWMLSSHGRVWRTWDPRNAEQSAELVLQSDMQALCTVINLADFFIFVCEVSTRQKLSTCNVLRLLLVSALISLHSHLLDVEQTCRTIF